MRRSIIPGAIQVAFTREPDFFAADGLAGAEDVTVVARQAGQVVGLGRLSVHGLMRNGLARRIGYLGALRVTSGTRESARLIRDGYRLLAQWSGDRDLDGCFTSIAADNARARRVLEHGGRFGLPEYRPLCDLVTLVAPVTRGATATDDTTIGEQELSDFLQQQSRRSNLTLEWDASLWQVLPRHGISARDFRVVRRSGEIVAAGAVWDQRAFRQTVIDGYSGMLHSIRPFLNGAFTLLRQPPLPAPGSVLAQGALLGAFVRDAREWPGLWVLLQERARAMGLTWLTVARDARDPELPVLRRLTRAREYHTTLYEVSWRDGPRFSDPWDSRCCHPEVSLL
jgi:hypothetical protein